MSNDSLRNPGFMDRYTCPSCYHDFSDRSAVACPACGAALHCRVEQEPVCVCTLGAPDTEED